MSYLGNTYFYSDPDNSGINANTVFYNERLTQTTHSFLIKSGVGEYHVENGVVVSFSYIHSIDKIAISSAKPELSPGNYVYQNNNIASDGIYKLQDDRFLKSITVGDGRISSLGKPKNYTVYYLVGIVMF